MQGLLGIRKAITNLNPEHVRQLAERPLRVAICAADPEQYAFIQSFLLGDLRPERRRESLSYLHPGYAPGEATYDLVIYDSAVSAPPHGFIFPRDRTDDLLRRILKAHPDLGVALARAFPPFRQPFVESVIRKTSNENTLFSLATALPDVIPSFLELPWAVAEFASDTAFLTANQLRMAFLIAAASDREVGYREQKSEIASVIAGAFGWRAIARQLVGKIPLGGGLIAKSAVAYAGTRVIGLSLERLYRLGYTYSREERVTMYADAIEQGKKVAGRLIQYWRPGILTGAQGRS
ncbi:MAG TPA: hypothetical protein VH351_15770 [Bryobacteraceae bacterium]|nr:hypothetical protein [Bryobacteraceae bacterium]